MEIYYDTFLTTKYTLATVYILYTDTQSISNEPKKLATQFLRQPIDSKKFRIFVSNFDL